MHINVEQLWSISETDNNVCYLYFLIKTFKKRKRRYEQVYMWRERSPSREKSCKYTKIWSKVLEEVGRMGSRARESQRQEEVTFLRGRRV